MTLVSAALMLFLIMDPFGNIPFFISSLKTVERKRHCAVILRELCIALCALMVFLFFGKSILSVLHISEPALTISGGTILLLIALRMIFPSHKGVFTDDASDEPFIVPLAIPYVAGPSAFASVMIIMNREPHRWREWLVALILAWFVTGSILLMSGLFLKILGKKVLTAIERLMGMVLVTMAIQMLMNGISEYLEIIGS